VAGSPGEVYYFHGDHLGSTSIITDKCGNKVLETRYFPYGTKRVENSYSGCTSLDNRIRHFFTGQELDGETGLYFYGARYYDPVLGRFIQPDTLVPNPRDPQDLNRYTYAGNNPLKYTDPTGHGKFWKKVAGYVLVVVGVVVAALTTIAVGATGGTCSALCYGAYMVSVSMMSGGVDLINDRSPSITATLSCTSQSYTASAGPDFNNQIPFARFGGPGPGSGGGILDPVRLGGGGAASVCLGGTCAGLPVSDGEAPSTTIILTQQDIQNALDKIIKSPWSLTKDGITVVKALREINSIGLIMLGNTIEKNAYGEYWHFVDAIVLNALNIQAQDNPRMRMEGHLVHEGTHAAYGHDKFGDWEYEKRAPEPD
jgi:RHS repeat-associated protein